MYILSTGCQWRALPKDLPPRSTVHDYLGLWNWDGTLDRIHHALFKCREKAAREASPRPASDSQSVKSAEKGGLASTATASRPIKGKKRHVLVDTQGLLLHGIVTGATFRIATAVSRCRTLFGLFPFLGKLFADSVRGRIALAGIPRSSSDPIG